MDGRRWGSTMSPWYWSDTSLYRTSINKRHWVLLPALVGNLQNVDFDVLHKTGCIIQHLPAYIPTYVICLSIIGCYENVIKFLFRSWMIELNYQKKKQSLNVKKKILSLKIPNGIIYSSSPLNFFRTIVLSRSDRLFKSLIVFCYLVIFLLDLN